jgi:hypothetical protein
MNMHLSPEETGRASRCGLDAYSWLGLAKRYHPHASRSCLVNED